MLKTIANLLTATTIFLVGTCLAVTAAEWDLSRPDPVENPHSQLMLDLPGVDRETSEIDFAALPVLKGQHAVVTRGDEEWQFRLHEYLAWFDGQYWCIWSHGPVIEDKATQHIRFSASKDGLNWTKPQVLVGPPQEGYGYIARGLWIRDGELIALASLFEAPSYSGGGLSLEGFRWDKDANEWKSAGTLLDDSLNNFAPKKTPDGNWLMSRRNAARDVSVMIGGVRALDDWEVLPLATYTGTADQRPEEPYWYILPDGKSIVGLFRNNNRDRRRLLRAFSTDNGRTWSKLVETNFPDARSKFNSVRTSRGDYALVSNPNTKARNPLCLSVSKDGLVYTSMAVLPIDSEPKETLQYPHVIEHDGHLLIAFSRNKRTVEVVKIPLTAVDVLMDQ